MKEKICGVLSTIGFMALFSIGSAFEAGNIDFITAIVLIPIASIFIHICLYGAKAYSFQHEVR